MAEVKRATPTPALSSLSSKKPPTSSYTPSSSSSSKHIYDDVFASAPLPRNYKLSRLCPYLDDDYGDIFGSSKSDDGSWIAACSSVPVLELSPESGSGGRPAIGGRGEREIDYCGVFGGFGDDGLGVPDGKELFDQLKKNKAKTSSSSSPVHLQRSEGHTPEVPISHISRQPDTGEAQSNGFCQSLDKVEHFKHKNNGITPKSATYTTHVHDTPGFTCQLDEGVSSQKSQCRKAPVIKVDTELGTDINLKKKQDIYCRSGTVVLAPDEQNSVHDACSQKASGFSVSNSDAEFHDTAHEGAINVPFKIVEDDAKVGFDVEGDASLEGVSDLGANRKNTEHDARLNGVSVATSHEASEVAGCSNMVDIEANLAKVAAGSNVGKKKWRHSRMTSLDLGDHKEARKDETGFHRKSRLGTSYSFDASHDPISARIRVQSSRAVPSSSVPQFFPVESHCKILENSSESSANNAYSFEEQLDVGSAAAVSVAALQRALQEAEMKMRLAKQFLEREGQGSTKWSFKDTLKAKVAKETKHANDLDEFRPLSFKGALKEKVVKDNKRRNDVNEFQLHRIREDCVEVRSTIQSSDSERRNVNATAQFTPVLNGQRKSSEGEDPEDGEGSKVSTLIEEGDKHEGEGEREAAKPLNQLISGVKNRIASFMTWRADAEEKVESQEIEATNKSLQPSGEIQPDLKDLGISEKEEAEHNKCASVSAGDSDNEETAIGLVQMASEPKEEESTTCTTLKEDKAGGKVDLIRDSEGSSGESFLHFTFMGKRSHNLSGHEGEKKEPQETKELEFEKIQEPLLNEAKDEQIQGRYEEAKWEVLDGSFMSQDCGNCNEESDEMVEVEVEVEYSKAENEIKESIHEEQSYRRPNEQHREEQTDKSDRPEDTIKRNERDVELEEYEVLKEAEYLQGEVPIGDSYYPVNVTEVIENDKLWEEESLKETEAQQDNIQPVEETNQVGEIEEGAEVLREIYEWHESERVETDEGMSNPVENVTGEMPKWVENKSQSQTYHTAEVVEHFSFIAADADCRITENVFLRTDEEVCQIDWSSPGMEGAVFPDEESDRILEIRRSYTQSPILPEQESERMMEIPNPSSEPKINFENPISTQKESELIGQERLCTPVSTENHVQCEGIECQHDTNGSFPYETPVLEIHETDAKCVQKDIGEELTESKPEDTLKHHTDHLHAYGKTLNVEEVASVSDQDGDKCSVEAGHRRRRWFEDGDKVGATDEPSIFEGCTVKSETDQEVLEECDLVGSVEIDPIKVDDTTTEISNAREANTPLNEDHKVNVQAPQKRRRWFVNKGEGVPEPPNLFESTTVTSDVDPEIVNESIPSDMSDKCVDKLPTESGDSQTVPEADMVINELKDKHSNEAAPRRKRWFENGEKVIPAEQLSIDEEAVTTVEINEESITSGDKQKSGNRGNTPIPEEKDGTERVEPVNELHTDSDAVNKKEKERAKERIAVERAIREARERAFTEARERARRDAVERPNAEPRQRAGGMAQDRTGSGKAFAEATSSSDRASMEAKLRVERAAVERATAEARERAMQKAKEQAGRPAEKNSSMDPRFHSSGSYSSSHSSNKAEKFDGAEAESPQRHKARLERQNRTMERAAKALEEKNKRDVLAQKEQAARNMLADSLDAEVKRWSCGKEGNLRALLSTLQCILGPESGWQAVSLTDLVAPTAVRKAYKKANLCVHPDKLQQRGASVQQKYKCEKVFDLLKEAWSKFNPDER